MEFCLANSVHSCPLIHDPCNSLVIIDAPGLAHCMYEALRGKFEATSLGRFEGGITVQISKRKPVSKRRFKQLPAGGWCERNCIHRPALLQPRGGPIDIPPSASKIPRPAWLKQSKGASNVPSAHQM